MQLRMRSPAQRAIAQPARQAVALPRARFTSTRTAASAADRVQLGDSDLNVSVGCLGTMTFGKQNTEAEAHQILSYSFDQGINFLDTAEMYPIPVEAATQGSTDRYVGTWLKNRSRDSVVLATKVAGYSDRVTWVRNPPRLVRVERDQIIESVDASLKRLRTDYIDLLQIHWPDRYVPLFGASSYDLKMERENDIPLEEQLRAMEEVVKAGKVRYIGVSNETSWGVCEFAWLAKSMNLPKIQTIQNSYSLLVRSFEVDLAEACRRHKVSLLAYSPLAGGGLTNKYNDGSAAPGSRFSLFPGYMERYQKGLAREATLAYTAIAKKHGLTPTELALAWCRSRWFVASSIFGATNMEQLKANISAFDKELTPECLADIAEVYKKYRDPTF